jgi:SAM-dependent methyltransferase
MNILERLARKVYRKLKSLLQKRRPKISLSEAKKLHLGCGNIMLPGYCNVDILNTGAVDIISDISKLDNFQNDSIESIYACHVLEHFSHEEVKQVLRRWFDVLAPGGELRISVPDIDRIVKIYHENLQHFQIPGHTPWIGLFYGGQGDPYDFHKTGFNFCWMKYLLEDIGLEGVKEYPHEPHFISGYVDASLAKEPFGQYLSLNVVAYKPLN